MTDSELKALCEKELRSPGRGVSNSIHAILRQVLTLEPEPTPPKSKGKELAQFASERFWTKSALAAAIDKAIADERQACIKAAGYHGAEVADCIKHSRDREDKQEETRT